MTAEAAAVAEEEDINSNYELGITNRWKDENPSAFDFLWCADGDDDELVKTRSALVDIGKKIIRRGNF